MCTRPFKKFEVLIFGAALGYFHYLVHLMPISTILSEINQYLDLPHRLWSFRVLVHTLTLAGMGDYILGWSCLYNFLKTPGLTLLYDAEFKADHHKIIKIYIFKKNWGPRRHFGCNNNIGGQKNQNVKMITNGVLIDAKWWVDFKSGIKFKLNSIRTHLWQKNCRKLAKLGILQILTVFRPKGGKCYSIWILMPDLESSHHLGSPGTPIVIIFTFWNFWLPMLLLEPKCRWDSFFFRKCKFW